jgi:hypothetical protein
MITAIKILFLSFIFWQLKYKNYIAIIQHIDIYFLPNGYKKKVLAPGRAVRSTPQRQTNFPASHGSLPVALCGVLASIPGAGSSTSA